MEIELRELFFKYRKDKFKLQLDNVKFESNAITCIIGPNGNGKTTLLHLLAGLYRPLSGNIFIDGMDYQTNSNDIYKNSYFSVDSVAFYKHLSGYKNLKLQCIYRQIPETRINEVMEIVGLENDKKKFKNYSTGMKQKLNIANALLHKPKLIVLDEPFNGLDPGAVINVKNICADLNKKYGTTIIITTHLLKEADSFCTNYCILKDGQVIENKKMSENNYADLETNYINLFNIKRDYLL